MDEKTKKALENLEKTQKKLNESSAFKSAQQLMKKLEAASIKLPDFSISSIEPYQSPPIKFPKVPIQEEINEYQSASVLMQALAKEATQWKEQLPDDFRPAILAILPGGLQINMHTLSQVTFHGIRIEGKMNDSPCSLLAHQSTVQILCYAEEITPESPRRPIGFIWDDNVVEV